MKVMVLVLTRGVAFSIQKRGRGERASLLKPDLHFVLEGLPRLQGLTNARQKKGEGEAVWCSRRRSRGLLISESLSILFIYSVSRSRAICQPRKIKNNCEIGVTVGKPSGDIATAHDKGGSVESDERARGLSVKSLSHYSRRAVINFGLICDVRRLHLAFRENLLRDTFDFYASAIRCTARHRD